MRTCKQGKKIIGSEKDEGYEGDGHKGAFCLAMLAFVQVVLAERNHLPEADYGMGQPRGVAYQQVQHPTRQQGNYERDLTTHTSQIIT